MSITIKDVAKAAGVSPSTVSRVINGKGIISEETKQKILGLMEKMDYFPNSTARSFVNGNTEAVALIVDVANARAYSNDFFNNSVFGIETVAHRNDYNLIITNGHESTDHITSAEKLVRGKKVDGIILPASIIKDSFLDQLNKTGFPHVLLGEPGPRQAGENSWVDINNIQGGENAAGHLLEQGYRKIAFLSSGEKEVFNQNRITGYSRVLAEKTDEDPAALIRHCAPEADSGTGAMTELLQSSNPPDAVICSDYHLAVGALRAAKRLGVRVPADLGIVSFDNSPVAELSDPPLTTVDIDTFGLGEEAAKILLQTIREENASCKQVLISTRILPRESTARAGRSELT